MSRMYTAEEVADNVHDMVMNERARARRLIASEVGNFACFVEHLPPEDRDSPLGQAFIKQFALRFECLDSRFPHIPGDNG